MKPAWVDTVDVGPVLPAALNDPTSVSHEELGVLAAGEGGVRDAEGTNPGFSLDPERTQEPLEFRVMCEG